MQVGFVGVGRLGGRLAASLLRAGFALSVHDLDRDAARPLEDAGAEWAESPAAAAAGADVVVTCLPSAEALAEVVSGPEGIVAFARADTIVVDLGTHAVELSCCAPYTL